MNREEWQGEYKRLKEKPLAPYLRAAGFSLDEARRIPARNYGELAGLSIYNHRDILEEIGILKQRSVSYLAQKMTFLPIIAEHALNGDLESFSDQTQVVYEGMPEAFTYFYADMPEEYRRDFVIGCYIHHGDSLEECREAVTELRGGGRDDLPEEVDPSRLPEDASDTIRLVRIGDYDVCPCIGRHVRSTSQIGRFEMLGTNWDEHERSFRVRFKIV